MHGQAPTDIQVPARLGRSKVRVAQNLLFIIHTTMDGARPSTLKLMSGLAVPDTGPDVVVEVTVPAVTRHEEEAIKAPGGTPRVGHNPELGALLLVSTVPRLGAGNTLSRLDVSGTDDLDGVSSEERPGLVRVDAARVGHEIRENRKRTLCNTMLHNVSVDLLRLAKQRRDVPGVGSVKALDGRSVGAASGARSSGTVSAGVGKAVPRRDTVVSHPLPGVGQNAAVASHVGVVARNQILSGKFLLRSTAKAELVGKDLGSRERPARTALFLVLDTTRRKQVAAFGVVVCSQVGGGERRLELVNLLLDFLHLLGADHSDRLILRHLNVKVRLHLIQRLSLKGSTSLCVCMSE